MNTPTNLLGIDLYSDGKFGIGPLNFDQYSNVQSVSFGEVEINKEPGEGKPRWEI